MANCVQASKVNCKHTTECVRSNPRATKSPVSPKSIQYDRLHATVFWLEMPKLWKAESKRGPNLWFVMVLHQPFVRQRREMENTAARSTMSSAAWLSVSSVPPCFKFTIRNLQADQLRRSSFCETCEISRDLQCLALQLFQQLGRAVLVGPVADIVPVE